MFVFIYSPLPPIKKKVSIDFHISSEQTHHNLFIYLGFYVAFNTVQVISRRVVGRAEETSTYSSLGFCTVNCRPTASNYQLSHLRPCWGSNPDLRGGRRECYHSATVAPQTHHKTLTLKLFSVGNVTPFHSRTSILIPYFDTMVCCQVYILSITLMLLLDAGIG